MGCQSVIASPSRMPLLTPEQKCNRRRGSKTVVAVRANKTSSLLKKKKRVRFSPELTSVSVRPVAREDLDNSWYQPDEYGAFDDDRKRTIAAVRYVRGNLRYLDPEEHCVRGLEQLLSANQILARKFKTAQYTRSVLEQQRQQRSAGIQDSSVAISAVSLFLSKQAGNRAHLRAMIDRALSE